MAIIKRTYRNKKRRNLTIFYQAEVFVKGVRVAVKNFSQKREAILWHEHQRHKFTFNPDSLRDRMLFQECVEDFYKDAKTRMTFSSYQRYEYLQIYLYNSPLAKIKMSDFKGMHVVQWIDWLKKQPTIKSKKRKSFLRELKFLNTILTWYKNFRNEDFNVPIAKKHKQLCLYKPSTARRPDYFIKPEDAMNWIEWLKAKNGESVYWKLATLYVAYRG